MEPCASDPAQTAIELKYGSWRIEEAARMSLQRSACFSNFTGAALTFPPQRPRRHPRPSQSIPKWTVKSGAKVVADRIDQNRSETRDERCRSRRGVDAALLRGVPSGACNSGLTANRREHRGAFRSSPSFDFDSPSNKVSRVARAIATIQRLLRPRQKRSVQIPERLRPLHFYPNVNLEAEHFDVERQWLASMEAGARPCSSLRVSRNLLFQRYARKRTERVFQSIVRPIAGSCYHARRRGCVMPGSTRDYFLDMNPFVHSSSLLRQGPRLLHLLPCVQTEPLTRDTSSLSVLPGSGTERFWLLANTRNIRFTANSLSSLWNHHRLGSNQIDVRAVHEWQKGQYGCGSPAQLSLHEDWQRRRVGGVATGRSEGVVGSDVSARARRSTMGRRSPFSSGSRGA